MSNALFSPVKDFVRDLGLADWVLGSLTQIGVERFLLPRFRDSSVPRVASCWVGYPTHSPARVRIKCPLRRTMRHTPQTKKKEKHQPQNIYKQMGVL